MRINVLQNFLLPDFVYYWIWE